MRHWMWTLLRCSRHPLDFIAQGFDHAEGATTNVPSVRMHQYRTVRYYLDSRCYMLLNDIFSTHSGMLDPTNSNEQDRLQSCRIEARHDHRLITHRLAHWRLK